MTFLKEKSNLFKGLTSGSFLCDYILSDINLIDSLSQSLGDKNLFRMMTNFLKRPSRKSLRFLICSLNTDTLSSSRLGSSLSSAFSSFLCQNRHWRGYQSLTLVPTFNMSPWKFSLDKLRSGCKYLLRILSASSLVMFRPRSASDCLISMQSILPVPGQWHKWV